MSSIWSGPASGIETGMDLSFLFWMLLSLEMPLQSVDQILRQLGLQFVDRNRDAQFAHLCYAQSGMAARVDVGERGQVHVHVERQALIAIAIFYF
jgi:hypothetical protein